MRIKRLMYMSMSSKTAGKNKDIVKKLNVFIYYFNTVKNIIITTSTSLYNF